MNTKDKIALCNNLNMSFDEASELFCEESLQSMQMAKISGGAEWWDNFCDWVSKAFEKVTCSLKVSYNSKTGWEFGGVLTFIVQTTARPTGDGILYSRGGLNLSNYGCTISFVETSRGVFNFSSGSLPGVTEAPTLA